MTIRTGVLGSAFVVLAASIAIRTAAAVPPELSDVLELPDGPARLVFFQPGDCELRRRAILDEVTRRGALPVVLYGGEVSAEDLGRLLGEEAPGVEVLRLPDVGFESTFRDAGVRATPFVLTLDADGRIDRVIPELGGPGR